MKTFLSNLTSDLQTSTISESRTKVGRPVDSSIVKKRKRQGALFMMKNVIVREYESIRVKLIKQRERVGE